MKFRKKPLIIEAIQWTGINIDDVKSFMQVDSLPWNAQEDGILIATLEGNMLASKDDWIIKGIRGEFYPIKPGIFESAYDKVE